MGISETSTTNMTPNQNNGLYIFIKNFILKGWSIHFFTFQLTTIILTHTHHSIPTTDNYLPFLYSTGQFTTLTTITTSVSLSFSDHQILITIHPELLLIPRIIPHDLCTCGIIFYEPYHESGDINFISKHALAAFSKLISQIFKR
jgi:hypothetical protein